MQGRILQWPRAVKRFVVMGLDVTLAILATWIAYTLRLDAPNWPSGYQGWVYLLAPALALPIFIRFGLYQAIFRYTDQVALQATGLAVLLYACVLSIILLYMQWPMVPRSLGVLQPLIFLFLLWGSRSMARFWLTAAQRSQQVQEGRLLIYGAGTTGAQTASALRLSRQFALVGFVDDDAEKIGRSINGVPVYSVTQIAKVLLRHGVTDILLALPSAARQRRNAILANLRALPVHVRTLPGLSDLASGRVTVQDFHELDLDDLLGRDPVACDTERLKRDLHAQVVLVSGAGGSIGSELTRQIVLQRPRCLLLLDHNEFGLYSIHQELLGICRSHALTLELVPLLASVGNAQRLADIFARYQPQTVYHAAAYKHVPMVECNAGEGILNNVFGTLNMAQAARHSGVANFVLISTDKAVRPSNVMGASKRVAELILQALGASGVGTRFSMVRFGNVLGSSGSVVPLFRRQIAAGGPITLTHPEVTRYFMSIPEAAQLVLQASTLGQGGEVFVLDMGQPVKIIDLAKRMVTLSGLRLRDTEHPQGDIAIVVSGLRPGEKLYEELLIGNNPQTTAHPRIMKAQEEFLPWPVLTQHLANLREAAVTANLSEIKTLLKSCVNGYQPSVEEGD